MPSSLRSTGVADRDSDKKVLVSTQERLPIARSPYAYAFLIAGVSPSKHHNYKGYFYNILVSASILHEGGSTADICLMIQMADPVFTELPSEDVSVLNAMNIQLVYLETNDEFSFEDAVFMKFQLLQWTQYQRVFFLDADIMPLCNLDYIFHGSENRSENGAMGWEENLLIPGPKVPSGAGNFMVNPQPGDWERLKSTIKKQKERAKTLPYPHFDIYSGWGFNFKEHNTFWRDYVGRKFTKWDFYGAHIDQGLLYYFVRFIKGTYSIAFIRQKNFKHSLIESYAENGQEVTHRLSITDENRAQISCLPQNVRNPRQLRYTHHPWYGGSFAKFPFHSDFLHFYHKSKPWNQEPPQYDISSKYQAKDGVEYWFHVLRQLDRVYEMRINWKNFYHFQDIGTTTDKDGSQSRATDTSNVTAEYYRANDGYWAKYTQSPQ